MPGTKVDPTDRAGACSLSPNVLRKAIPHVLLQRSLQNVLGGSIVFRKITTHSSLEVRDLRSLFNTLRV